MAPPCAYGFELYLAVLAGVALLVGHGYRGHMERVADSLSRIGLGPSQVISLSLVIFLHEGRQAVHLDVVPVQGLQGPLQHLFFVTGHQGQVNLAAVFLAAQRAAEVDHEQPPHAGFTTQHFGGTVKGVAGDQLHLFCFFVICTHSAASSFDVGGLSQLVIGHGAVQPRREVEGNQPTLLVLASGHVFEHPHQDLPKGGATLAFASPGVLGPVEVVRFEVGLVLALGVALGVAGARLRAVADWRGHGSLP